MGDETFKERYLSGEIPFEEIDRYVSRWNNSDEALQDMLDSQKR